MEYVHDSSEPGACWTWAGFTNAKGYARFGIGYARNYAHRVSFKLFVGPIPAGLEVCHTCDNPSCVNPKHLFVGTQDDNAQDMVEKGRSAKGAKSGSYRHPEKRPCGERNAQHKLTDVQVLEIRSRYQAGGVSQQALAIEYGVCQPNIGCIVRREHWKHI
jgi:hypothetical protein